uniref:eEF-1B gamma n=1 Tax=Setaria digitata TaxID=48799 RepID=A0A915Q7U5_9BILA
METEKVETTEKLASLQRIYSTQLMLKSLVKPSISYRTTSGLPKFSTLLPSDLISMPGRFCVEWPGCLGVKIYGSSESFRMQKILIAAKIGNKDVIVHDQKPPRDKFPLGVTPAMEDENISLFGADAIMLHLASETMKGANCSEVLQWMQWSEGQLIPNVLGYVLPSVSAACIDSEMLEAAKKEFFAQLSCLNELLLTRTFLVGERMSLADISVAMDLVPAYQYVLDETARTSLVNITRWFKTIINQPHVKDVLKELQFAVKVSEFSSKKFNQLSAKLHKEHAGHKDGKNRDQHEKQTKEQKEDKKTKETKETSCDEPDAADEALAQEPKSTDPFLAIPKGSFVMDSFKRVYSNEDTATKAIPYFWENFDPENYSIWFAEYKYPEDLTLTFMSCNLISGMFQRLEKLKKNAFASVCLFGTDNNSTISGIWIWRGHDLAFKLSPDWQVDYESYDWKKLDPTDEKTKKIVNEYLMWEGEKRYCEGEDYDKNFPTYVLSGTNFLVIYIYKVLLAMSYPNVVVNGDELSDEEILQLSSANFSLRVALIFLIVTVLIFGIMQLIKLIIQIRIIRNTADKRKKEAQSMTETNTLPYDKVQNFSEEISVPEIRDSLASSDKNSSVSVKDLQHQSAPATELVKQKKPTLSAIKTQDSLMIINNQVSLQPVSNVQQRNLDAGSKEQKATFSMAKPQDSLMVIDNRMPLQPANSAEKQSMEMALSKSEESNSVKGKGSGNVKL